MFFLIGVFAFTTTLPFRFFTFTFAFLVWLLVGNDWLIKLDGFGKILRRALMFSALTNLRDTFTIVVVRVEIRLLWMPEWSCHRNFNIKIINDLQ